MQLLNIHSNSTKLILSVTFFVSIFLATFIMSPSIYALDIESLVGAWLFDEGGGDTIKDSSGNGHDGEIVQAADWVDGKFGSALEFDGSGMATVPDAPELDLSSFTLSAWINVPKISGVWQIIASKENRGPTARNYGMFCNINSGVVHYSFTTNNGWKSFNAATVVTDGEWHHVAATYEKPDFKLYLDGEVDAQVTPGTDPDQHDGLFYIGGCDIGNYWMTGVIDEVLLFNKALSPEDIQALMGGVESALPVQPKQSVATVWGSIKNQ